MSISLIDNLVASCSLSMVNLEIVFTVSFFIDVYSHVCLEDFELCWQIIPNASSHKYDT